MEIMAKIASSILTSLYQAFLFAVVLSVSVSLVYAKYRDIKAALKDWVNHFKIDKHFRWVFFLTFYTVMILFRTLLNRNMWANPVSNIIGIWGIYDETGALTTQAIENFMLFIPFAVMLLHISDNKRVYVTKMPVRALLYCVKITFLFSALIEFTQLFLRLGTFQLSDFFYNTAGGFIGGLGYYSYLRIKELFECFEKGESK